MSRGECGISVLSDDTSVLRDETAMLVMRLMGSLGPGPNALVP